MNLILFIIIVIIAIILYIYFIKYFNKQNNQSDYIENNQKYNEQEIKYDNESDIKQQNINNEIYNNYKNMINNEEYQNNLPKKLVKFNSDFMNYQLIFSINEKENIVILNTVNKSNDNNIFFVLIPFNNNIYSLGVSNTIYQNSDNNISKCNVSYIEINNIDNEKDVISIKETDESPNLNKFTNYLFYDYVNKFIYSLTSKGQIAYLYINENGSLTFKTNLVQNNCIFISEDFTGESINLINCLL